MRSSNIVIPGLRFTLHSCDDNIHVPDIVYIFLLSLPLSKEKRTTFLRTLLINCSWILTVFQVYIINEYCFMILTWIKMQAKFFSLWRRNHLFSVRFYLVSIVRHCCGWSPHNRVQQYTDDANYFNLMINRVNTDC